MFYEKKYFVLKMNFEELEIQSRLVKLGEVSRLRPREKQSPDCSLVTFLVEFANQEIG